jgi:hypothetical protein
MRSIPGVGGVEAREALAPAIGRQHGATETVRTGSVGLRGGDGPGDLLEPMGQRGEQLHAHRRRSQVAGVRSNAAAELRLGLANVLANRADGHGAPRRLWRGCRAPSVTSSARRAVSG